MIAKIGLAAIVVNLCALAVISVHNGESRVVEGTGRGGVREVDLNYRCGPVSVAVVAQLLKRDVGLEEVAKHVNVDAMGRTSIQELVSGLEQINLFPAALQLQERHLAQVSQPLIVHFKSEHFAVVVPGSSGHFVVFDPPREPVVRTKEAIARDWSGKCVLVAASYQALAHDLNRLGLGASVQ